MRTIRWFQQAFVERPTLDVAVSRALLRRVAAGTATESLRLHRTGDWLAFSVLDRAQPGFARAVSAARATGFTPLLRLAGGRAAVFHTGTLAFSWSCPVSDSRRGVHERFDEVAQVMRAALRGLGVDARVGEVPGEYCPGRYSVNAGGRVKLVGIGQRVVRGAAHVGGVIVVRGSERVREALAPVYPALGIDFDPARVGSLEDEIPGIDLDTVRDAVLHEVARRAQLVETELDADTLELARGFEPEHAPTGGGGGSPDGAKQTLEQVG